MGTPPGVMDYGSTNYTTSVRRTDQSQLMIRSPPPPYIYSCDPLNGILSRLFPRVMRVRKLGGLPRSVLRDLGLRK